MKVGRLTFALRGEAVVREGKAQHWDIAQFAMTGIAKVKVEFAPRLLLAEGLVTAIAGRHLSDLDAGYISSSVSPRQPTLL